MNLLEISHLSKKFGSKEVLSDVSLTVPEHCIYGFIGKNGAGKTTTMKAILGLIPIDGGEIKVCGEKVRYGNTPTNRLIGFLPDVPEFYNYMTAEEYLRFCGEITHMDKKEIQTRTDELLKMVGLSGEKHRIQGFSRGMKQRLGIAQALMNRPKLLICDEPTSALDPVGRREILEILQAAQEETSVLFSTHILSDVERICSRISLLNDGKIALSGSLEEIRSMGGNGTLEIILRYGTPDVLLPYLPNAEVCGQKLLVKNASQTDTEKILKILIEQHIEFEKIEWQEIDLEQRFMEVIGK